ncbi:peptidase C65 Otubain-domain-containing protein [Poronia punctata]|nr:peptidase C65 Otubain-domain-containing protein [Poronia punctata]
MFQAQPTPYAPYIPYGFPTHNPGIPEYTFGPTPLLGQYAAGGAGESGGHRHGHAHVRGSNGGDDGITGADGRLSGLDERGGPAAPASSSDSASATAVAPTRAFTVSPVDSFDGGLGTGTGSGIGSGVAGGHRIGGTGVIRGLGHGTSVPSTVAGTSASGNSAGYSSNNDGSSSANNVHPHSYNLNIPISVPPRLHNQHNHNLNHNLNHNHNPPIHQDHGQHGQHGQQSHLQNHQHYRQPGLLQHHTDERHRASISSSTGSILSYEMEQQSDLEQTADLSQQDVAATNFKPQVTGPLVGEKVSSQVLSEEYAGADPTFVAKTMSLPRTYPHYRPVQGDGNCGWRAIAFAYFEILVQSGDINILQNELQRIVGLNKYIEQVGGQDPTIFEDMVSETLDLFNDLIAGMSAGHDPMPILMVKFNDPNMAPYFVYHLRLLACARMKESSAEYGAWLGSSVGDYIQSTIMPVDKEIDHICLNLLSDILLRPANIGLEVAYLDRSDGTEVNVHRMSDAVDGQDSPSFASVVSLLYRPGHYDILYRGDAQVHVNPAATVPVPVDLQVHRATYQNEDFEPQIPVMQDAYSVDLSALAMIPGLPSFGAPSTVSPSADLYAPSPTSPWAPQVFPAESISAPPLSQPSPPHQPIRFSKYNFPNLTEMATETGTTYEPAYSTPTFKNSHFNVAHYSNLNFQPELYQPDAEEEGLSGGHGKPRGRKRSTDHTGVKREK